MTILFCEHALLEEGWADRVRLELDENGHIARIETGASAQGAVTIPSPVLPGMANLHSHAFQRAMAGLAESRGAGGASFWSWRDLMYRFVGRLDPDQIQDIATWLYIEMLKAGYCSVAEFHYLHHDGQGRPYAEPAETSLRHLAAAEHSGIGLTLLPVFYAHSGFGGQPPAAGQRRFVHGIDGYLSLLESLAPHCWATPTRALGLAFHSLRAVTGEEIRQILALASSRGPVHIHVAEQMREVEHCLAWSGMRPVRWLADTVELDSRWCLIHATHTDAEELDIMARAGVVAGLCPTTEADLGDGLFPAVEFLERGGIFGVGSDSHVAVDPAAELKMLEYGQRLTRQGRNLLASDARPHTAAALWRAAARGGARALGQPVGALAEGRRADLVILDAAHPLLEGCRGDDLLGRWLFAGDARLVRHVMVGGEWMVRDGHHANEQPAAAAMRRALGTLLA